MSGRSRKSVSRKVGNVQEETSTSKVRNDVASGVSELYFRYNCNYCQEDIPGLRIKCAECSDFDLCLDCFASGATHGSHKNYHKYYFMNNGGFSIFPPSSSEEIRWNAREDIRLLDAVEQYGYGNWKDISEYIESKSSSEAKEQYIRHYIFGVVGKNTWREKDRGLAVDHTDSKNKGPLSSEHTSQLPPMVLSDQEAMLLGYLPQRDDFEDFDKETELLVSILEDDSSSSDFETLEEAFKYAHCDMYERRLREEVRRKRLARDYQLAGKFYGENPIVTIGGGSKCSPVKISNQVKAVKKAQGPLLGLYESFKSFSSFLTASELTNLIQNLCFEKELKVRVKELLKYRTNGLKTLQEMNSFEKLRFKREFKTRRLLNKNKPAISNGPRLLPLLGDYSLLSLLDPTYYETEFLRRVKTVGRPSFGLKKKKPRKAIWSRRKEKTGRRLLIQQGCILTVASEDGTDSSD